MFPSEKSLLVVHIFFWSCFCCCLGIYLFLALFCFSLSTQLKFQVISFKKEWRQQILNSRLPKVYQTECRNSHMCLETFSAFLLDYKIYTSEPPFLLSTQHRPENSKSKEAERASLWQKCCPNASMCSKPCSSYVTDTTQFGYFLGPCVVPLLSIA